MTDPTKEKTLTFLDITIVILSVYVLIVLLIDSMFELKPELSKLLYLIDDLICLVFIYDFIVRFMRAESKWKFMKWGWIDMISSIPTFEYLRYGRLIRLFRIIRVLRTYRSLKYISDHVLKNRTRGTFQAVALIAFMMILFGSIAILQVEKSPESNIKTAEDAIWWAFITISTVGYGDKFPITTEGRIIAGTLMITGVGLFGTFTGYVTAWFIGGKINDNQQINSK